MDDRSHKSMRGIDNPSMRATFTRVADQWRPAPLTATDTISRRPARALAALFDVEMPASQPGDPLPPLWHWLYFPAIHSQSALGEDGHPRHATFMPPIPDRRRMFGGGRLRVDDHLRFGETVERRAEVIEQRVREGRNGPMLIVTVRHTFTVDGAARCTEEQDLVYLSLAAGGRGASRVASPTEPTVTPTDGLPAALRMATSEVLLFRFSALTWNSHRIHYDQAYTTEVEGHPALVVHGPLLALLLLEAPRRNHPDRRVRNFAFRARRPMYVGSVIEIHERLSRVPSPRPSRASAGEQVTADASAGDGLTLVASSADSPGAMEATVKWAT